MRLFLILALVAGLFVVPVLAGGDGDCPYSQKIVRTNCNQHMCPMARAATDDGYTVVSELPLVCVTLSELEV